MSQIEESFATFAEKTSQCIEKFRTLRGMLRHLRVDAASGECTDPVWLKSFDETSDQTWTACRELLTRVTELQDEQNNVPQGGVAAFVVDIIQAAREMVQADNACMIGHLGCEQRWDRAMSTLKNALHKVRD